MIVEIIATRRDAAMVLTAQSHHVHIAADGTPPSRPLSWFRPDIMLIDIGLPV